MSEQVLPFYLVCDESWSMEGPDGVDAINGCLPDLHREIGSNPVVADKTRFCIISFNHEAQVLLPLADLSELTTMPAMSANGGTEYGTVFNLLRSTIEQDVARLKQDGHQVLRPAVFFLSDGQPNDSADWHVAYQRVIDPSWSARPNILAFAFNEADEGIIKQIATVRAFSYNGTLKPAQALQEFAQSLIRSIVRSGTSGGADGGMTLAMPDTVPGFTTIPADVV
ncbi:VWA domain-containing protein [Actinomadura syzygii]|uniref:VWA domain-containing protein n=1 Tax=Actinomadura syzygii TaxID=1427538 RepID=A0A5D0U3T3_9ACTN|nr:VWA domain-containing protein [Actinomadura syzygii]TYC12393.1 VWA domain-containing protein [Actinomadura syzygii]